MNEGAEEAGQRAAIGISGITARPPQRRHQAGRQAVIPPDVACPQRPVLDAYQMSRVWWSYAPGAPRSSQQAAASKQQQQQQQWSRCIAPVVWARTGSMRCSCAWFSGPCASKAARTWLRFGGVRRRLLFGHSPDCVGACPNRPFSARGTALSGKGLCPSIPVLSWMLSSPLSHQRALPPAEVARWTPVQETPSC